MKAITALGKEHLCMFLPGLLVERVMVLKDLLNKAVQMLLPHETSHE